MTAPAAVAPALAGITRRSLSGTVTRMPALREQPNAPESGRDGERLQYFHGLWTQQDTLLLGRDRTVEENLRMLWGEQWSVYHAGLGKWYDLLDYLSDDEKRWRQRPVVNRLLRWFMLTHARMTENPAIITWVPGPDRADAELAEVLDLAFKVCWRDAGMEDVVDRLFAWVITAGRGYVQSRIDPTRGDWQPLTARVPVPLVDASGQVLGMQDVDEEVPVDASGQPLVVLTPDGPMPLGPPIQRRTGAITCDVLSPLEVRGAWGPQPWHQKAWHATECWYTSEELFERYGVEIETPSGGASGGTTQAAKRLLYGAGGFGAASARNMLDAGTAGSKDLIRVRSIWMRPNAAIPDLAESADNPGGRFTVLTDEQVLYDGPRPAAYPYTSPIEAFDFVRLPGRPHGTSPQEALNGPQRSYNKQRAQILEHGSLVSNPKYVYDGLSGVDASTWTNEPGTGIEANIRQGVPPVQWLTPPPLGDAVYRSLEEAAAEIEYIGQMEGTGGKPPTKSASGALIDELRFNEDRFIAPTMRRSASAFARIAETWRVMLPLIWDREHVLAIGGDDRLVQTITVYPEMWESGTVNAVPDTESMLPEGRGERRARVRADWQAGAFGPPLEPEARRTYLQLARFPHDAQSALPQNVDWQMANRENGLMAAGATPDEVPILPWHDHAVHLQVHEGTMKGPEFLRLDPQVQQAMIQHRAMHIQALQQQFAATQPPAPAPGTPPGQPGPAGASPPNEGPTV